MPQPETRPYVGEHSAVITDKSKYDEFRRKNGVMGMGVDCVYGIWDEDGERKSEIHAFRFDADRFTVAEAKQWLKDHDYKWLSFEPAVKAEDKSMAREVERRIVAEPVTCRTADGGGNVLEGYAAVFNRETVIGNWFREVIEPGAFREAIGRDDVRALFNHDANIVLGRTTNNTLRLREDERGLHYEVDLNADDPDATRVYAKVSRGDVNQSSFAFWVNRDDEEWDDSEVKHGKLPLRRIKRFSQVDDVSAVTFPAYESTTVSARAENRAREIADTREQEATERDIARDRADVRRRRLRLVDAEG